MIVKSAVASHAKRDIIEKMVFVLLVKEKIGWDITAQVVESGLNAITEEVATLKILIQCFAPKVITYVLFPQKNPNL